jgi:hypothetical protein
VSLGLKYDLIADGYNLEYYDPYVEAEKCDNVR